jgi:hypothetical protein
LPLQSSSIGLRSTAAKILYVEASHVPIVNDWTRLKLPSSPHEGRSELLPAVLLHRGDAKTPR